MNTNILISQVFRSLIVYAHPVLKHDKNVLNWGSEDLHWFKVKGKHTVAKVQKAYHKKCGVMTVLHQGDHVVALTSQMHQINHFKDDIIFFLEHREYVWRRHLYH